MAALVDSVMEEVPPFEFQSIADAKLECLESADAKTALMQWNLDGKCMKFAKFRFTGAFEASSNSDYDRILKDFMKNADCMALLGCTGTWTGGWRFRHRWSLITAEQRRDIHGLVYWKSIFCVLSTAVDIANSHRSNTNTYAHHHNINIIIITH